MWYKDMQNTHTHKIRINIFLKDSATGMFTLAHIYERKHVETAGKPTFLSWLDLFWNYLQAQRC